MPPRGRASGRPDRPARQRPPAADRPGGVTGGPAAGDIAQHRARLRAVIEPVAATGGFDLEDLSVIRMGRRYVVRVTVDRDGGVGLDAVADLARAVSAALDEAEVASGEFIAGEYQLEVGSPGVDRPLKLPRHWRRNVGRLVKVQLDGKTVVARLTAADEYGATLDVKGKPRTVGYAELGPGRVEIEFSRLDEIDDEDMVEFASDDDDEQDEEDEEDEDDHADDEEDEEEAEDER